MAAGDITAVRSKASDVYSAASFDGVDDVVNCGPCVNIGASDSFSICGWFLQTPTAPSGFLFGKYGNGTEAYIYANNGTLYGQLRGTSRDGESTVISPTTYTQIWNHVVFVRNVTTDKLLLYQNGVFVGDADDSTNSAIDGGENFTIGERNDTATPFKGCIRDVRFYNKALSTTEISTLYSGLDIDRGNLIGEWKLQTDYNDTSGNGNHGTNSGTYLTNTLTNKIKADMQGMNLPTATDKIIAIKRRGSPTIVAAKRTP